MITKTTKKKAFDSLLSFDKALIDITESSNLDHIIQNTVNELGQILDVDRCFFAGISYHEWVIQVEYLAEKQAKSILGDSGPFNPHFDLIKDFVQNEYLVINDIDALLREISNQDEEILDYDREFITYIYDRYQELNIKSCVYLAIKINNHICGVLGFHRNHNKERRRYKWSQEEIELLNIVAKQISKAISESQLINDLRANNEQLLELDKLKSQIMSTVSHELKTPMSNILGFSELLLHRDYPPEVSKEYLKEIHSSSIKLSKLIADFLDLSRIEARGEIHLNNFEETDIEWLAERSWEEVSSHNTQHEIKWRLEPKLPYMLVDQDSIARVFTNLFSNAIKYSPEKSAITCRIYRNFNDLVVSIEDEGFGIPDDMVDSVFDRFIRVDNSNTREVGGTGLGLWISKQIIQAHQGQIWCESKVNKGSKFAFVLPIHEEIGDNKAQGNDIQVYLY